MNTRTALAALLAFAAFGFAPDPDPAPVFSNPTEFTNVFAPFRAGSVKVFRGRSEGARTAVIVNHLVETRLFPFGGGMVECGILEEKAFEDGQMVEISHSYIAQDDEGNVRYFGEVSVEYSGGIIVGPEVDSWLVGGPTLPGESEQIQSVTEPAMYMIANPQEGDSFNLQAIPGAGEIYTIQRTNVTLKTPAARYENVLRIQEVNDLEPGPPETVWVAPGVGLVREKARKVRTELMATSLIEVPAPQPAQ